GRAWVAPPPAPAGGGGAPGGRSPPEAALEFGSPRGGNRLQSAPPGPARGLAPQARPPPQVAHVGGNRECGLGPAELLARALDLVGAERRALALLGAGLPRRPQAHAGAAGRPRAATGAPP